jgi:hypothetical protein
MGVQTVGATESSIAISKTRVNREVYVEYWNEMYSMMLLQAYWTVVSIEHWGIWRFLTVFWDMMLCGLVRHYQNFVGMCSDHLHDTHKMVVSRSSKT